MVDENAETTATVVEARKKGRPPYGDKPMKSGIYLRCSDDQKAAITEFVENLNEKRRAEGLPRIDVSSWIRELALKHSGNSHMGLAVLAAKMAKVFSI